MSELEDFKRAIRIKYDLHCHAFEVSDAQPIIEHFFTPDALWAGQGYPERRGRAELEPFFAEVVQLYRVSVRSLHTYVKGDVGWDYTDYPVIPRDTNESGWNFRPLFVWVRQDGEWFVNAVVSYQL